MNMQTFTRLRSAALAGALVFAPVVGVIATAPVAAASVVVVAEDEPTPALDGVTIENPDGEDIVPVDAPIEVTEPVVDVTEPVVEVTQPAEPISAALPNPWPGRVGSGLIGMALGGLLGHLFHRKRYVQFESRV